MDIGDIKLFKALNARMHWLNERQRVLAQNVANADTPRYHARDVSPLEFRTLLNEASEPLKMTATHVAHKTGSEHLAGVRISELRDQAQQSSPTGNSVILEEEMMKVAETAHDYELMTNLYRKGVGMLRMAISRPRG